MVRTKFVVLGTGVCVAILIAACGPSGPKTAEAEALGLAEKSASAPALLELGVPVPNDSPLLTFQGWSGSEKSHRWSEGKKSSIEFMVTGGALEARQLVLVGWPHGRQRVRLFLNGKPLATTELTSTNSTPQEFVFSVPAGGLRDGVNNLLMETPDAKVAGPQDPRIISLALTSFVLR